MLPFPLKDGCLASLLLSDHYRLLKEMRLFYMLLLSMVDLQRLDHNSVCPHKKSTVAYILSLYLALPPKNSGQDTYILQQFYEMYGRERRDWLTVT